MNPRRRLLLASAAACALPIPYARTAEAIANADSRLLVLVYLKGGNDSYNTFVPYTDPRYTRLRPTIAVAHDQVIKITDRHGFHPSMRALMPLWEAKELAIIQGIGQAAITNQHYRDLEMQFTAANLDQYYTDGWLTRALTANPSARNLGELSASRLDAIARFPSRAVH